MMNELGNAPLLSASGLRKSYSRGFWPMRTHRPVLHDASLALHSGEVVGLTGENGSGKSTLMRILVGELAPDAGMVERVGVLGYCPQEPQLYERLTCDEHFELFASAYGLSPDLAQQATAELYETLGFDRYAKSRAGELSGGTASKLNLALALLADPAVLLLDEPYAGFDWDTYLKFWEIVAIRRAAGHAVLIISHFVVDEERFDRIIDIRNGVTVAR